MQRLFKEDLYQFYNEHLDYPISLVEFRKYRNPQMYIVSKIPKTLESTAWGTVPGANTGFLITNPQRDKFKMNNVFKVSWKNSWNGLNLSDSCLAKTLVALSLAPGLGIRRRSYPAPIYWADGIAGANDTDLRFRGQRFTDLPY